MKAESIKRAGARVAGRMRTETASREKLLRAVVVTRVAMAGALFCTVLVGALFAVFTGGQPPAGLDVAAAVGGGIAAGAIKALYVLA